MNTYITAPTIKALREQKKLTQAQLWPTVRMTDSFCENSTQRAMQKQDSFPVDREPCIGTVISMACFLKRSKKKLLPCRQLTGQEFYLCKVYSVYTLERI